MQGVRAVRIESRSLFDSGFDLDKGNRRKEEGILVSFDPVSKAGLSWTPFVGPRVVEFKV